MKVILWSIRTFWYKGLAKIRAKIKFVKKPLVCKNSSSDEKAVFHQRVQESMKFVFDKCVLNVTPVTNLTPMSKSDE